MLSSSITPGRLTGPVLALLVLLLPGLAFGAMSETEAARMIEQDYGVQVLKVRGAELGGRKVWMVTVMTPPGDSNTAFQVNTLAVDQESGALVPAFRHGTSGPESPSGLSRDDRVGRAPEAIRSRVWR
ncbi:MAG: hypothetical protein OEM59_20915 [Rhodospirillales bacterium]|nr:hypothetical protein [Rhodospirillales bacterium]